mmetsp:Transcript_6451/g.21634  ORF Transcript_6451/g.21634 Transcript_6451/m.21634 type:complete len:205 (+) Transcript_6451:176-790(+)
MRNATKFPVACTDSRGGASRARNTSWRSYRNRKTSSGLPSTSRSRLRKWSPTEPRGGSMWKNAGCWTHHQGKGHRNRNRGRNRTTRRKSIRTRRRARNRKHDTTSRLGRSRRRMWHPKPPGRRDDWKETHILVLLLLATKRRLLRIRAKKRIRAKRTRRTSSIRTKTNQMPKQKRMPISQTHQPRFGDGRASCGITSGRSARTG